MKKQTPLLVLLGYVLFCLNTVANANLLINGDFEINTVDPDIWNYDINPSIAVGSDELTGWTVTRDKIEILKDGPGDGIWVDLDGSPSAGGIAQSFSTQQGVMYRITFNVSGMYVPDFGFVIKSVGVSVAGQLHQLSFDASNNTSGDYREWAIRTLDFEAVQTTTTLEFYSMDAQPSWCGAYIDNVTVEEVPEPCTLLLLEMGGLLIRKRKLL